MSHWAHTSHTLPQRRYHAPVSHATPTSEKFHSPSAAPAPPPALAVIIPTLNEERTVAACLHSVGQPPDTVIVVSDGGSRDATVTQVRRLFPSVRIVSGAAGRGGQLARGVAAVPAEAYLFLHADCRLPVGWHPLVHAALSRPGVSLGCFRLHTEPPPGRSAGRAAQLWWRLLDLRSFGLGLPYGDQGLFLRAETLRRIGGVPDLPLMEDLELARRCRQIGSITRLPVAIHTSARRFAGRPVHTRLCTLTFPWLYRLGVSATRLATWYGYGR